MSARDAALKIILSKRRTGKEVYEKLLDKGFESFEAEEAVLYFKEKGYIDEGDYAKRFARDAVKIKGFGRKRIEAELKKRGIGDSDIDAALSEAEFDIVPLMLKKFPSCEGAKEKNKIINHFLRRGFSIGEITDALRESYGEI